MKTIDEAPIGISRMLGNLFDERAVVELVNQLELVRLGRHLVNQRLGKRHRSPSSGCHGAQRSEFSAGGATKVPSVSPAAPGRYQGLPSLPIPKPQDAWRRLLRCRVYTRADAAPLVRYRGSRSLRRIARARSDAPAAAVPGGLEQQKGGGAPLAHDRRAFRPAARLCAVATAQCLQARAPRQSREMAAEGRRLSRAVCRCLHNRGRDAARGDAPREGLGRRDVEAARWLAALMQVPHAQVRLLDVPAEALSVEKRMREPVARQALAVTREELRVASELKCQPLVLPEIVGDELRQSDGL